MAVLFPPESVPVIDIFRALGNFEEHYDIASLDELESRLTRIVSRDVAKGIVSDALLLAFGLRRERVETLSFSPLRSRRGTLDEYRLLALISATYWHDFVLASAAAAALEVAHAQPLVSLAFDISRRFEAAGLKLVAPDARLFRLPSASSVEMSGRRAEDRAFTYDF